MNHIEAMKQALEKAYLEGFQRSSEGYNADYGMTDPENDRSWLYGRDCYVKEVLEQAAQSNCQIAQFAPDRKLPAQPQHPDDQAVDRFAAAMKDKLAKAREKGRSGWEKCPPEDLSRMLREHVEKGDPRDVANFCMMLWNMDAGISAPPQQDIFQTDPDDQAYANDHEATYGENYAEDKAPVQEPPDDELTQALIERDEYHAIADELAEMIAKITGEDIGEHTSANFPWRNALDAAENWLCHPPAAEAAPVQDDLLVGYFKQDDFRRWVECSPLSSGAQAFYATPPAAPAQEPVAWPKERDLFLRDDMGQGQLRVMFDGDNDVIVAIWPNGEPSASLEFCNGFNGGGKSPETRKALIALMCAMERDGAKTRPNDQTFPPAAQPQWAVFCGGCRKEWSVPYQHPGKSICNECEAKLREKNGGEK